eukprot:2349936-Amphidinium_carterae.1
MILLKETQPLRPEAPGVPAAPETFFNNVLILLQKWNLLCHRKTVGRRRPIPVSFALERAALLIVRMMSFTIGFA